MRLGLHKEPSKFPDIDPIEVHVRRQLSHWGQLVQQRFIQLGPFADRERSRKSCCSYSVASITLLQLREDVARHSSVASDARLQQ